jgi:SAM-dependent methyltransferase
MTGAVSRIRDRVGRIGQRIRGRSQPEVPLDELQPPEVLTDAVSGGHFQSVGREYAEHLIRLGGLRPSDRVLDVGCGTGRVAVPLVPYLDGGSYEGFDVHDEAIRWCQSNITSRSGSFRFQAVSVRSRWFNPWGAQPAEDFTFPYPDDEFDFAFAISLFTHLLSPATERYLSEIARVLKPGGRWLLTFFLIPEEGHPEPFAGWPPPPGWPGGARFNHEANGCRYMDPDHPERAVAHEESWLFPAISRARLSVKAVHRGFWPGRHGLSFQDIVIGDLEAGG